MGLFCFVEANVDGKVNGLKKTVTKKGDRKALNDITNKSSNIHIEETSTMIKNVPKKEELLNVAQEMFLHDHKKCIESQQQGGMNSFYLDLVLPGHGHGIFVKHCLIQVLLLFYYSMSLCFLDLIGNSVSRLKSLSRFYSEWYFDTWDLLGTKCMTTILRYWNGYFANFWFVFSHSSLFVVVYCLTDYPRREHC